MQENRRRAVARITDQILKGMRLALLPSRFLALIGGDTVATSNVTITSINVENRKHYIISAPETSKSFQSFKSRTNSALKSFAIPDLLPEDWKEVLRLSAACSHPSGSYTFAFPGGGSASGKSGSNSFHILQREEGDFSPNDLVYVYLQRLMNCQEFSGFVEEVANGNYAVDAASLHHDKYDVKKEEEEGERIAALSEQNHHVFSAMTKDNGADCNKDDIFYFYPYPTHIRDCICFSSPSFVVMVNLKPICPNHLLLIPKSIVRSIHGLNGQSDLMEFAQLIHLTVNVLKGVSASGANTSFSIAIQQGPHAGQTVPHLHMHVIPMRVPPSHSADAAVPDADNGVTIGKAEEERRPRTAAEMREEKNFLEKLFHEEMKRTPDLYGALL